MKKVTLNRIYGNEEVKLLLSGALERGNFFHAVVLAGKEGTGKKTLVNDVISAMACLSDNAPCGECDVCRKIQNGECVDVYTIKKPENRALVPIESIRDIYSSISYKPNDLDFKVYILPDGDKIAPRTQNALLKLLEEPPDGVYFFILCEDENKLLPTIRSRCEIFRLDTLPDDDITAYLKQNNIEGDIKTAVALAKGSYGKALDILSSDSTVLHLRNISDKMIELLLSKTGSEFDLISYQIENIKSMQDYCDVCRMILSAIRDIITVKQDTELPFEYFTDREDAETYAQIYPTVTLLAMSDVLFEILQNENVNARLTLTVTEYSSRLWKTKYNGDNKCLK